MAEVPQGPRGFPEIGAPGLAPRAQTIVRDTAGYFSVFLDTRQVLVFVPSIQIWKPRLREVR